MTDWPVHSWTLARPNGWSCDVWRLTRGPVGRLVPISPTYELFRSSLVEGLGRTAGIVEACNMFSRAVLGVLWRRGEHSLALASASKLGQLAMRFDEPRPRDLRGDETDPFKRGK